MVKTSLPPPDDSAGRKAYPVMTGCLNYAPAALAGVARWSKLGNEKHNPGQELHHARGKSMDHGDCIVRHLMDIQDALAYFDRMAQPPRDPADVQQLIDDADALAWRALMLSQELHERFAGAPLAPGARLPGLQDLVRVGDTICGITRPATEAEVVMRGAECGHQQGTSYAQKQMNTTNKARAEHARMREADRVRAMRGRLEGERIPLTGVECDVIHAAIGGDDGPLERGDTFLDGTGLT